MPNLTDPSLILPSFGIIVLIALLVRELKKRGDNLDKNSDKSYELLHQAIKKAENIIALAELSGIKVAAQSKLSVGNFEKEYQNQLDQTAKQAQQAIATTEKQFKTYLENLATQANESVTLSEETVTKKVNALFEKFESNLSAFLTETQSQSIKAIELEIQAARQLIETYKTQQFNLIDENIVAMLERTLSLVLIKKLSLKEQVDLVYESLEKAKAEKFVV